MQDERHPHKLKPDGRKRRTEKGGEPESSSLGFLLLLGLVSVKAPVKAPEETPEETPEEAPVKSH